MVIKLNKDEKKSRNEKELRKEVMERLARISDKKDIYFNLMPLDELDKWVEFTMKIPREDFEKWLNIITKYYSE